jgi:hypothetical protein
MPVGEDVTPPVPLPDLDNVSAHVVGPDPDTVKPAEAPSPGLAPVASMVPSPLEAPVGIVTDFEMAPEPLLVVEPRPVTVPEASENDKVTVWLAVKPVPVTVVDELGAPLVALKESWLLPPGTQLESALLYSV